MADAKSRLKRKTLDAAVKSEPVFIATAKTCIGTVDVSMYPPTKMGHRFAISVTTKKGDRRTYHKSHMQNKASRLSEPLRMKNRSRKLSLIQLSDVKFELKHNGLPDCSIKIVKYAVKPPKTKYNGIGLIVASVIGTNANGYEPYEEAPGQDEENGDIIDLMQELDDLLGDALEPAEVIGGPDNVWNAIDDIIAEGDGSANDNEEGGDGDDGAWFWERWYKDLIDWGRERH